MTHRVLVAEPSATLATLIRLTLGPDGLDLRFVTEGPAALESARRDPPDLLLIDAALPGLDGYAVVETLRAEAATRDVTVILTIADYLQPDLERVRRAGIVEVLSKPFERHALRARVRAVLDRIPPRAAATPPAASSGRGTATPAGSASLPPSGPALEGLVESAVQRALPALVRAELSALLDERLTEALAQIVGPHLAAAIDAAVARALPDVLETAAFGLSPKVEATLDAELQRVAGERAERVAWKVVPELAEQLIRDELERLTRDE